MRFTTVATIFLATTLGLGAVAVFTCSAAPVSFGAGTEPVAEDFDGTREETLRLMAWYDEIELTPEQEAVRQEALGPVPAACCKEFSAATCCCVCNLSRATWGLAKHLIADEGAEAETVRISVAEWQESVAPEGGFTGTSCGSGRCGKSFAEDGCGGMRAGQLVF